MAFTGVPVVQKVTDRCWRITGVSLAPSASGTIQFSDAPILSGPAIVAPDWQPYSEDGLVSLQDMVKIDVNDAGAAAVASALSVVKAGSTHADFVATLANNGAAPTPTLEIYVQKAA